MTVESKSTIQGKNIFFNFIEVPFEELAQSGDLIKRIKQGELHGFVLKNLFQKEEINEILKAVEKPMHENAMETPYGRVFPSPFAIITDSGERLETYYKSLNLFLKLIQDEPSIYTLHNKLQGFFEQAGKDYKVSVPVNKTKKQPVAEGTVRLFYKDKGALFVHCGNLFQQQSEYYYSQIENDIDKDNQLSYFVVLQNTEQGGELTIYDMLWENVVGKASQEENDSVIDKNGKVIYLKDVEQFTVRPDVGDVLVFAGGPIWHRVEDIRGDTPRITFGGFLNFSKDEKELYYWS